MDRIKGLPVILHAMLIWGAFIPLSLFADVQQLYVMMGCLAFTVSVAVAHAYAPLVKTIIFKPSNKVDHIDYLTLGIVVVFTAIAARTLYITLYRNVYPPSGNILPEDYYWPLSFLRWVLLTAGILHLSARPLVLFDRQYSSTYRVLLALVLGTIMGFASILMRWYNLGA